MWHRRGFFGVLLIILSTKLYCPFINILWVVSLCPCCPSAAGGLDCSGNRPMSRSDSFMDSFIACFVQIFLFFS